MSVFFTSFSYPESPGLFGGAKIEENGDPRGSPDHESKSYFFTVPAYLVATATQA